MGDASRLSYQRTMELIPLAKEGDTEAMEELVRCNMALVRSIVKKYINRGVEYDDLYQIGSMGLVKAVKNFDPSYNVRFSTYAVPMIAGEIKRYIRDDGMIKVSRSLKELAGRAAAAQGELASKLGRDPGIRELAGYMGEDPEDISLAMDASRPHISIYEPAYGEEGDALVMDRLAGREDGDEAALDRVLLQQLMGILEPREQKIIMLRYFRDKTQSEIAASMGISQVQVSRLESRIMKKLRERAADGAK
ncbi:MAG: SigB/SigF/SigG family RNA polymerase sigma factor [Clostridia bacterium]|nr:SigB/SigF/SigG family RNA polymerase sigma factor [Clostridia bacterium]MBQ6703450.1 SigB/SigF/SigG family RNA polymerase sigma factor [Clostridia bacterium]